MSESEQPEVTVVSSKAEFDRIINGDEPSIFDFWATWCGPCRMISPVFADLSRKTEFKNVKFYKVDVDDQPEISEAAGITAMPTFILYKKGEVVDSVRGAVPPAVTALVAKGASLAA